MNAIERSIPVQQQGIKKEFTSARRFTTLADAQLCYATAVSRLMNVNHWHELTAMRSTFRIMSKNFKQQKRRAKLNDFIAIGIPAPENPDGAGFDWVRVVNLKFLTGRRKEQCLLTLQPCPMQGAENTAHFFSEGASSSFLLTRSGNIVTSAYYGRNELPNMDTSGVKETVRNIAIAAGAMLGFSDAIWGPLTVSFIMDGTALRARGDET